GVSAVGAFCLNVEAVVLPVHTTIEPDIPTVGPAVRGRSLPTCQAVPGLSILEVPGRLALPIAGDTQEELTAIEVQIAAQRAATDVVVIAGSGDRAAGIGPGAVALTPDREVRTTFSDIAAS